MALNRSEEHVKHFDPNNKFLLGPSPDSENFTKTLKKAGIPVVMDPISGEKYIDITGTPLTISKFTRPEGDLTLHTLFLDTIKIANTSDKNSPHDKRTIMHVYDIGALASLAKTINKQPSVLAKSLTSGIGVATSQSLLPVKSVKESEFNEWDPHASLYETVEEARERRVHQEVYAVGKVKMALLPFGYDFNLNMIKQYWFGANQYLKFDNEFADVLIYLVTGRPVVSKLYEDIQLGPEILTTSQRKSISDALLEISELDHDQLACLIKLYHKDMAGSYFKHWHWFGNEVTEFTRLHADALNVLVLDQDMAAMKAIDKVHDMSSAQLSNIIHGSQRYRYQLY